MAAHGIGAVGTRREIEAFGPLGVRLFEIGEDAEPGQICQALRQAADAGCAVIILQERLAVSAQPVLAELARATLPAVLLVPGAAGSTGAAMSRIREIVEKAVGADILFQKESR